MRWAREDYEDRQLKAARTLCGLDFGSISGSSSFRLWIVVNYAVFREIIWIMPSSVKDADCDAALIAVDLACEPLSTQIPCAPP